MLHLSDTIALRNATRVDETKIGWFEEVSMKDYATALWGEWTPNATVDIQAHEMIEQSGNVVGCLATRSDREAFYVTRLYLAPDARNFGIGTLCMQCLLTRARAEDLPVRLRVLTNNPAQQFYRRLGFHEIERSAFHFHMEHPIHREEV